MFQISSRISDLRFGFLSDLIHESTENGLGHASGPVPYVTICYIYKVLVLILFLFQPLEDLATQGQEAGGQTEDQRPNVTFYSTKHSLKTAQLIATI